MLLYALVLTHRLQILLDDARHDRLVAAARSRGVSVATVVRDAIDRGLPAPEDRRRAAAISLLAAEPMHSHLRIIVPSGPGGAWDLTASTTRSPSTSGAIATGSRRR